MATVATVVLGHAAAEADYRSLDPSPIVVEGGVLLCPIARDGDPLPPQEWPRELAVVLEDGREVPGRVGWMVPSPTTGTAGWTECGEPFTIVEQTTDPEALPLLLADLPRGYRGDIDLPAGTVTPRWLRPAPPPGRIPQAGTSRSPDALPDSTHPLEWFRWVLLAERVGDVPPPPPGDEAGRLAARHLAEVWRAAIARIERASPGVAEELRQRLVATCTLVEEAGPEREIAAWIADPRDLRSLLGLAIDDERDTETAMQAVLSWLRGEAEVVVWAEESRGEEVVLGVANPGSTEALLRCRWLESDPVPLAVVVPPRTAKTMVLQRPVEDGISADGGVLVVEHGPHRRRVVFGTRPAPVRPPGASLGPFRRPVTLASLQADSTTTPPADRGGSAELRRRQGRWELFLECLRPPDARRDEVTVRIGDDVSPVAVLRIPERGSVARGDAEVSRVGHEDRWRCRVVLPEAWLAAGLVGRRAPGVGISIERRLTLGDGTVERTAIGTPPPPWRDSAATEVWDLSRWPKGPGEATARDGERSSRRILAP